MTTERQLRDDCSAPLSRPLEVGFRVGALTVPEKLRRYADTCEATAHTAESGMRYIERALRDKA